MSLAAGLFATQTDFAYRQRGASSAEDTVQHSRDFVSVQSVKPLHNVGKLEVLLQCGFLIILVVALGAADTSVFFGPRLRDATLAEVVFAWQLDGFVKNIQANRTQKLLFKAVLPTFIHVFSWMGDNYFLSMSTADSCAPIKPNSFASTRR